MKNDNPSRRTVLRAMLAVGGTLWLPRAFAASAPETSGGPKKLEQSKVQYQPQPKGEQKCAGCMHFIPESNTCKVVAGDISPDGWCTLWVKKP